MNRAERRKAGYKGKNSPLQVAMAVKGEQVVIEFGDTVKWFAMNALEAEQFIAKLQAHVEQLKVNNVMATSRKEL